MLTLCNIIHIGTTAADEIAMVALLVACVVVMGFGFGGEKQ